MRMFLIVMCDIFLILYLTSITNVQPKTFLTVEDFHKLHSLHEELKEDKQQSEEALQEQLRRARQEKEQLAANIVEKKDELKGMEEALDKSDARHDQINKELMLKEAEIKSREQLLAELNKKIEAKEEAQRKMQAAHQKELKSQEQVIEETREKAEEFRTEAQQAQQRADQMKEEAAQAFKKAETAKTIQQKAETLKEQALKEKEEAERKAAEALAARQEAEAEKQKALKETKAAMAKKEMAEALAQELTLTVKQIKQDAQIAYKENIRPWIETLNVTWQREVSGTTLASERELTLLPLRIDGETYVVFPSRQIGFSARSDKAPEDLVITYQGKRIQSGWMKRGEDLIAISLPGYQGEAREPYPPAESIDQLMPILLALRNQGHMGLTDTIRGLADNYFIVKRDDLQAEGKSRITFAMSGFRGTGARGERVVQGDQLSDLNGRLIGIANDVNSIIRVNSLSGWDKISF